MAARNPRRPVVPIRALPSGRWQLDYRLGGRGSRRIVRSFDALEDAETYYYAVRREKQLGRYHDADDILLADFFETYWRFHALPRLSENTRDAYKSAWGKHLLPWIGGHGLREITPAVVSELPAHMKGRGQAVTKKTHAVLQSVLAYALVRGLVDFNAATAVKSPQYDRARNPEIFQPADVERVRVALDPLSATLVSLLAYSGPRPEECLRLRWRDVGDEAIFYDGQKTRRNRHTPLLAPLAQDLREWRMITGRPKPNAPVIPAHDGGHWQTDDWRNWRRRTWRPAAPTGSRPRDLRSSYVTVHVYAGVPLTTIARWCGTSVAMIDRHYAGVIANWDGQQTPADAQIRAAKRLSERASVPCGAVNSRPAETP